jgi:transcriptional regulator with XRE-family HTH domain
MIEPRGTQRQSERLNLTAKILTAVQCRGARAMIGWSQRELAEAAKVARQTVVDFERGAHTPYPNNLAAIRAALEAAGVEFIEQNGGGPGVRLTRDAVPKVSS